jgi:endonuclease YncB( thermonuclease family)
MGESKRRSNSRWPLAYALATGLCVAACSSEPANTLSEGNGDARTAPFLSGRAVVIDGDTLDIGATRVRLEGIDAPEASQTCQQADRHPWPCGRVSSQTLARLIDKAEVTCTTEGTDKYGRMLGLCATPQVVLNKTMVETGMAWAFVKYSTRYAGEEEVARRSKTGVWQGPAQAPWDYRQNRWQVAEVKAPEGCAIKGNISDQGRIYHMPWSPWYGKVTINAKAGERWFCSEAEAEAAGWRAARGA